MDNHREPFLRSAGTPAFLAARFLFPLDERSSADSDHWARATHWFLLWGLLTGILYAAVFRVAWRSFGEYQYVRFVPMAFVLIADLGWGGYRLLTATSSLFAARRSSESAPESPSYLPVILALVLISILKYAILVSLPMGTPRPSQSIEWATWRHQLGFLYPKAIYRPLILMPVWGRWAMMLALSIGRASPACSPRLRRMAQASQLWRILLYWLGCMGLTLFYASGNPSQVGRSVIISLGVLVIAYLVSFGLSRRSDGQTETSTLAAGLAGEMGFLLLYLPVASDIYWY